MENRILYLFTRTPLHVGAGSSVGAVDQPIQRERHTGFPIIPGSSVKGVIRDYFDVPEEGDAVFGTAANDKDEGGSAGAITFSEAKLLLFPLRSARGGYALATCPLALARYARDSQSTLDLPPSPQTGQCLAGKSVSISRDEKGVVLEEYAFSCSGEFPEDWASHLCGLLEDAVLKQATDHFVLLSDDDFAHFALNACQIQQHIKIKPETGTVAKGALFNTESVPPEALFYVPVVPFCRNDTAKQATQQVFDRLSTEQLMQFGGDATTGQGFCTVKLK